MHGFVRDTLVHVFLLLISSSHYIVQTKDGATDGVCQKSRVTSFFRMDHGILSRKVRQKYLRSIILHPPLQGLLVDVFRGGNVSIGRTNSEAPFEKQARLLRVIIEKKASVIVFAELGLFSITVILHVRS